MCEQVEKGEMPLAIYLAMHPTAKLTEADKKTLCDWANTERQRLGAASPEASPDNKGSAGRQEAH
jgi:hypothetical protein